MTKFRVQYQADGRTTVAIVYAPDEFQARKKLRKLVGHSGYMINKVTSEIFPGSGVWV